MTDDDVAHPPHYTSSPSGIECIQITEHMNFCIGNAVKYCWRAGLKTADPLKDLRKAAWYINREIERVEKAQQAEKEDAAKGAIPAPLSFDPEQITFYRRGDLAHHTGYWFNPDLDWPVWREPPMLICKLGGGGFVKARANEFSWDERRDENNIVAYQHAE